MEEKGWTWRRNRAGQSSSSPQQTPTSLCCCAGAATKQCSSRMWARAGPIVLITLMCSQSKQELPIWKRMGQSGGEQRSQKNLIEGEVPTKLVQKCNQLHRSTILIVLFGQIPKLCIHYRLPRTQLFFGCLEIRTGVIIIGAVHLVRVFPSRFFHWGCKFSRTKYSSRPFLVSFCSLFFFSSCLAE